ncbi:hypothetical protein ACIHCV_37965 [Streptomyces sp. NPDC051956]|uniref:hypothetical protein n=1 Tax=Streptomyces sp. NPDC051956 TaxID=3365677 RepID=UPI0037CFA6FF
MSPGKRSRLVEIRQNLTDRIAEAEREGWIGDVEGLSVSRSAAEDKIAQIDAREERKQDPTFLGVPSVFQAVGRTTTGSD